MRCLIHWIHNRAMVLGIIVCLVLSGPVAAEEHTAGLIVIKGDGTTIWITVPFAEDQISGAELIDRSGLAVTEVSFGGLGVGICGIEETGCDVTECRKRLCQGPSRNDPFWQYFRGEDAGTWTVAPLGVSTDKVSDGDVRALIWSADAPAMAAPTLDEIVARVGSKDGTSRFDSTGQPAGEPIEDERDVPWIGIVVIGAGVVLVGGLIVRRRRPDQIAA